MTDAGPPTRTRHAPRGLRRTVPVVLCLAGLLAFAWPWFTSGFDLVNRSLSDGRLVNYTLEHGYRWLAGFPLHADFWSPPIHYPYGNTSAFTDCMLGHGPPYWIWRALAFEPDTAFQLWTMSVFALNFACTYLLLVRGFGVGTVGASVGALLLAMLGGERSGHPQLVPLYFPILGLLALLRIFQDGERQTARERRAWIVAFFSAGVLQAWSAVYVFFFSALLCALGVLVGNLRASWRRAFAQALRRDAVFWVLGGVLAALGLGPLVARYGTTAEVLGYREFVPETVPHLLGWVYRQPARYPLEVGFAPRTPALGPITFVAAAVGLWHLRARAAVQVLLGSLGLLAILGSRYLDLTPWEHLHRWVPGAGGIRGMFRAPLMVGPVAALGVGLLVRRGQRLVGSLLSVLLLLGVWREHRPRADYTSRAQVRAHVAALAARVDPEARAFFAWSRRPHARCADDAAWASLRAGVPTINGRYGNCPPGYRLTDDHMNELAGQPGALERALDDWLAQHGIARGEIQVIEYEAYTQEPGHAARKDRP